METGTKCSAAGCENLVRARGLCQKHYMRWWRHGDAEIVLRRSGPHVVEHGTINEYNNWGCRCDLCKQAWRYWYRTYAHNRRLSLGPCTIPGCDIGQYAKGMCKPHYERDRSGRSMSAPIQRRPKAWVSTEEKV